jgi:energy-coupling factor transport system ATP-binding protein
MPQVSLLAHELRERGTHLPNFPITLGEAVKALASAHTNADKPIKEASKAEEAEPVLEVRELTFSYGDMPALHGVSLQVQRGDFLAVVGPNGAGKSTLAKHLIGLIAPPAGNVMLQGKDIHEVRASELAEQVAFVFQNPEHQFVTETVFNEIAYGLRVVGKPEDEVTARTEQLLDMFGLARYAKANPFTLSHGEKRRLSVAAMLAMGQDILILDEPTFGQDERNAAALMSLLGELNDEGKTIIMITHDMRLVAEYAHRVAVMQAGRVVFDGQPDALFQNIELLAQAHLNLPPLARLAALLGTRKPQLRNLATIEDFLSLDYHAAPDKVRA